MIIKKVIESTVCMYKSMKNIACHLSEQIQETIFYTASMLKESQQKMIEELKRIQHEAKQASNAVKNNLEKKPRMTRTYK